MTTNQTTLRVEFVSESAGFQNTFGWYNKVTGVGGVLFANVEAEGRNAPLNPGSSFAEFTVNTADIGNIEYFLIPDGANNNSSSDLSGPIKVIQLSDGSWAVARTNANGSVIMKNGKPDILEGEGANAFFTEKAKNEGGVDHASSTVGSNQTAATLAGDTADGPTGLIAWEDLAATKKNGVWSKPGDADYNDAVFRITVKNRLPDAKNDSATVGEDAGATAINVLANDVDPDGDAIKVISVDAAGVLGTVTIAPGGGGIVFNPGSAYQYLAAGESKTETFTYKISDGNGGTDTATVSVKIMGANDAPVVVGSANLAGTVTERADGASNENSGTLSATGEIRFADVDRNDNHTVSVAPQGSGYIGALTATISGGGDSGEVDWKYTVSAGALDFLSNGQTLTQNYTVKISDGNGGSVTQTVAIKLVGKNDQPVITSSVTTGTVQELADNAPGENTANHTATGNINFEDVDLADSHTVTVTAQGSGYRGTLTASVTNPSTGDGDGRVTWVYSVNDAALDNLAAGQTLTQSYKVKISDGQGGTVEKTVTITIKGAHDAPGGGNVAPVITSGPQSGAVVEFTDGNPGENTATHSRTGTVTFTDGNPGDTHTATVVPQSDDYLGSLTLGAVNQAGDSVGWTFNVADAALDNLAAGQVLTQNYVVTVDDGNGGTATQTVTVTITGTNDVPVIAGTITGTVTEDVPLALQTSGQLTVSDPDLGDTHTWSIVGGSTSAQTQDFRFQIDNLKIIKNGMTFFEDTFNNGNPPPSAPNIGLNPASYTTQGTFTEAAGRAFFDGPQSVVFGTTNYGERATLNTDIDSTNTIAGLKSNHDFIAEARFDLIVPEDVGDAYGIRLLDQPAPPGTNDSLVDLIVTRTVSGVEVVMRQIDIASGGLPTILGSMSLPAGSYDQIVLRLSHDSATPGAITASFEMLNAGVPGPTTTFAATGTIFVGEQFTRVQILGQATQDETGVWQKAGTYGTLTLAQDGQWHYLLADHQANVQALALGEIVTDTFTVQVSDGNGGFDTEMITVSVTGTNDAPRLSAAVTGGGAEGSGVATVNLLDFATDIDHGSVLHIENVVWNEVPGNMPAGFTLVGNSLLIDTDSLAYNMMPAGQTFTTHFTYDVVDENGASTVQHATITITGTNDAPTVSAEVTGGGAEGSGTATVNLLDFASDVDSGAVLHVENVVWDEVPGNLPVGFTLSGNEILIDTNSAAYNGLAQGETFTTHFTYNVVDEHGAFTVQHATVTITGTNDGPIATADVNTDDAVVEAGVGPGNTPFPGDASASGNVLHNDTDVDNGANLTVTTTGVFEGIYGTLTLGADGAWTYVLNNADGDTSALAQGESVSEVFNYAIEDEHGAPSSSTLTINIMGTNDQPVITGGSSTGSVAEDGVSQATGALNAFDPDHNHILTWTAQGGTSSANANYLFTADSFTITRFGNPFFHDDFGDNNPPPSAPNFVGGIPTGYAGAGVNNFDEAAGRLIFDSNSAVPLDAPGTADPFIGQTAIVRTNIDPASAAGLKNTTDFTVSAVFDLILPDTPREGYGIQLTDRLIGGPGTPPDQFGDDCIELVVRQNLSGQLTVALRELDFVNSSSTLIQQIALVPPPGADQIRLNLVHSTTDVGAIHASFEYLSGGVSIGGQTFSQIARIFGTETPGFTGDDEVWTRADLIAYAPAQSDSVISGIYGTLNVNQAGTWFYNLDNTRTATQNLAQGQTASETFTVQVTDEHGAFDTETITINVTGSNDGPQMQTAAVSRTLEEDSNTPDLTATGLAQFSDIDLIDTHSVTAVLQSSSLSNGGSLSPELAALLASALTAQIVDAATGDSHGEVQWDFALANDAVQFLDEGVTLTAVYDVVVTDNHGAPTTQTVTITITGTADAPHVNQAPVIAAPDFSNIVPNGSFELTDSYYDFFFEMWFHTALYWTNSGSNGQVELWVDGPASDGAFSVELDVHGADHDLDYLHQMVATQDGQTYTFSFDAAWRNIPSSYGQDSSAFEVLWNGVVIDTITPPLPVFGGGFTHYSYTVVADGPMGTVGFRELADTNDGVGAIIDNVALRVAGGETYEDTAFVIYGISVSDADAGSDPLLVSLGVAHGDLSLASFAGLTMIDGDGSDGTLSFMGSQAAINAALAGGLTYTPDENYNGADTLTIVVNDQGHNGIDPGLTGDPSSEEDVATIQITVHAVNDAPVAVNDVLTNPPDGYVYNPANGHYYRFVDAATGINGALAAAAAAGAYLATITSADENAFVASLIYNPFNVAWFGVTDFGHEGQWTVLGGPEDGTLFWTGAGSAFGGQVVPGQFAAWRDAGEPNGGFGENYAYIQASGGWNDFAAGGIGYVLELGGRPQDTFGFSEDSVLYFGSGELLANDFDIDGGPLSIVGVSGLSAYGAAVSLAGGSIIYDPTSAAAIQALNAGQSLTDTFTYTISDGRGGTDTATVTLTINGENDNQAPVITGPLAGSVMEGAPLGMQTSGQLVANDPDGGTPIWTIVGGTTTAQTQDFRFQADNLRIIKNGTLFFEDTFGDNNPPPSAPNLPNGTSSSYTINMMNNGSFNESSGRLFFDGTMTQTFGTTNYGQRVMLNTDTSAVGTPVTGNNGLKRNGDFTAEARFDLIIPEDIGDMYGIRLVDQPVPPGNNNSTADLIVMRDADGVWVALRQINVSTSTQTVLERIALPAGGYDQIVLKLDYLQSSYVNPSLGGKVTASFDLLSGGTVVSSGSFTSQGTIFVGEDFTRVQLIGQSSQAETGVQMLAGTYGTLTLAQDGQWHYFLADHQANVQALTQGQIVTDTFQVQVSDGNGGFDTETITVTVTGTNDAPRVVGQTTGSVTEDAPLGMIASGQLQALDPDGGAAQWSIVGGTTSPSTQDFRFQLDNFKVIKNGNVIIDDGFGDGNPPPNGPAPGYMTQGGFTEAGGRVFFDGTQTFTFGATNYGERMTLNTNTMPLPNQMGLKSNSDFNAEARFDLILPEDVGDAYGIRLVDQASAPPNNNSTADLVVMRDATGVHVFLRQINLSAGTVTVLESIDLPPGSYDQIVLKLDYLQSSYVDAVAGGKVSASFDLMSGGVVTNTVSFTQQATIFVGEDFTQAQVVGQTTQTETGVWKMAGTYGTLTLAQDGQWHYLLADHQTNVQALNTGQSVVDTFQVQAADGNGGVGFTTITVTINGTNEPIINVAPVIQTGPAVQNLTEGMSPVLAASGFSLFSDANLPDTHIPTVAIQSATASGGAGVSGQLAAALASAMSMFVTDPSTGDGFGQYQWNFTLDNDEVLYLNAGQSVTAVYQLRVTDPFGAFATQSVTISIAGASNVIMGTPFYDELVGTPWDDTIIALDSLGMPNWDHIDSGPGNDTIDGGEGTDVSFYAGPRASFTVIDIPGLLQVSGPDGTDTLTSVEVLEFGDQYQLTSHGTNADLSSVVMFGFNPLYGTDADENIGISTLQNSHAIDLGNGFDTITLTESGVDVQYLLNLINVEHVIGSDTAIETIWMDLSTPLSGLTVDLGVGFDTIHLGNGGNNITTISVETIYGGFGVDVINFIAPPDVSGFQFFLGSEDTVNLVTPGSATEANYYLWSSAGQVNGQAGVNEHIVLANAQAGTHFNLGVGPEGPVDPSRHNTLTLFDDGFSTNDVFVFNVDQVNGTARADHITVLGNSVYQASGLTTVIGGGGADMITGAPGQGELFKYTSITDSPVGAGRDTIFNLHDAWDVIDLRDLGVHHVELDNPNQPAGNNNMILKIFFSADEDAEPGMEIGLVNMQGSPQEGWELFYDHVWF